MLNVELVPLHSAAETRYLNYAMSVITSRALPDVRDGLKPVQRRILYTMFNELKLHPSGRYRKCAAVVGEVMGKFHPHGDQSIYDAMVRMAQSFSLRHPLVDGQGNFGSLDGDRAAAMRYTEAKLRPLAEELISEIKKDTVDFRPNYDGQRMEPVVLPAQFPQLLVNGSEGIAVGMATRIPPHHFGEIIAATLSLIDRPDSTVADLLTYVKGPDFPTGGQILSSASEIEAIYSTGQGSIRVRGQYEVETEGRRTSIVLTAFPFGQNKSKILEHIGQIVVGKNLPQVSGMRDESTEDVRVVIDLKRGSDPEAVMGYLFKNTKLEATWPVNLTALVPQEGSDLPTPARLDLREILTYWLAFRFQTVRRRFEFDLAELLRRIHILEGFCILFDALDEAIRLIRSSTGRRDASEKLISFFDLSELQTDAILDLQLYRLAKMPIEAVREELADKRAKADVIEGILSSDERIWAEVRAELQELGHLYSEPRRTVVGQPVKDLSYTEEQFIVKEEAFVVVTRNGWVKRQSSFSELGKIWVRDEDEVGWLFKAHTRSTVSFFSSFGAAYVMRVDDIAATTGRGKNITTLFNMADGDRIVGVVSHDARHHQERQVPLLAGKTSPPPYGVAISQQGRALRFPLSLHEDVSTVKGRRYARLKEGDSIFCVYPERGRDRVCIASTLGRAIVFLLADLPVLKAAGSGVNGINLRVEDQVMAVELASTSMEGPTVVTEQGRELVVRERKFGLSKRGAKGKVVLKRGSIEVWRREVVVCLADRESTSSSSSEKPNV